MSKTHLETRISQSLQNTNCSAATLSDLLAECEAATVAAEATAQAERAKALDPIASVNTAEAEKLVWAAEFRRDRLHSFLSQLRQRITETEAAECAAQWEADFETVKAERDAVAKDLGERYPELTAELCDLFRRVLATNEKCSRVNGAAPAGESRRLRGVELTARGLENFSISNPSIMETLKLPDWKRSDHMAWPPPRTPLAALVAAAMTPPHDLRYTGEWAAAREQDKARRTATETRWAEEEVARQEESKKLYERSLRR
jgi:hypothetical protein